MRSVVKLIALLFIAAFCYNIIHASHLPVPVKNSQQTLLSIAPSNSGSQAIESRNLTSLFSAFSDYSSKKEISCALIASSLSRANLFTGYIFYASYLILKIETTDLIFPFHFFW